MDDEVKAWQEEVVIPTYLTGPPQKNPMFLENRVYQGSSGVVYPYPIIEKITGQKTGKAYTAVFLENRYIRIMILPDLGGRVQMAFDKIRQRHFVYYNRVIKPALVGLAGPWISGGIEFNWPQHHRPSTFEPVDYLIRENDDGSKSVWINEVERMSHTKGMAAFTLYPGKARLEIRGKLYNRTPFPQTFLWWANPAVKVNDEYQSVFPPDVHAVYDHGRRDVSGFPIAKGTYYKVDYSPGTDISRYKNLPVPTSFMVAESKYDFIGGYEHDTRAGLLHIADHHISPGKKQWTWGNSEFGKSWDRQLTDEDGPYIELMTGVFTDNQPDFSWLQPFEEKTFVQYFLPYSETGMIKNASKDILIGLEKDGNNLDIRLFSTSFFEKIKITLLFDDTVLYEESVSIKPEDPFNKNVSVQNEIPVEQLKLVVSDLITGNELLAYKEDPVEKNNIPAPAVKIGKPSELPTSEALYLAGLHLEQYRHATFCAADYYSEALKRDPGDARNNNALGLWFLRRGQFPRAEAYFRTAISTLTCHNPNPYDGEPYYNLGWSLKLQNRPEEAYDAFYKSVWNAAWQHAGYLELARIAVQRKDFITALGHIGNSIARNCNSHTARHLKALILRYLGRMEEAMSWIEESLESDPFNFGCIYEKYLLLYSAKDNSASIVLSHLETLSRNQARNFLEYALDYAHAGLFSDAGGFLSVFYLKNKENHSLVPYYLGWFAFMSGDNGAALGYFKTGAALTTDFVFPNRIEEIIILNNAVESNPTDFKAWYYLGNLWYDKHQYADAIRCWEASANLNRDFPTVHRNLALACYNKEKDPQKALVSMETAFRLDQGDARVLMELDQLYKKLNRSPWSRLAFLEKYPDLVNTRDDLYLERITLYNQLSDHEKAKELLTVYQFHPWEGGEGKVVRQYLICHLELVKKHLADRQPGKALDLLNQAETYPPSLGEGKLYGARENDIHYLKGLVYEMMKDLDQARHHFELATAGNSEPAQAVFYNDPQPDQIFYQGLAWQKLGQHARAEAIFHRLIGFGENHLNDTVEIDYFAVSLPDLLVFDADLNLLNHAHCFYMMGLGYLGLDHEPVNKAQELFDRVLSLDINHQGALIHKQMIKNKLMH